MPERIWVIGMTGAGPGELGPGALEALQHADVVVGPKRALDALDVAGVAGARPGAGQRGAVPPEGSPVRLELDSGLEEVLERLGSEPGRACVLASGDPGFFGVVRPLAQRFGADRLEVLPAPSSVSLAFARLGVPWDDAMVVSAHGRPLDDAARAVIGTSKAAVLTSPDNPPGAVARALLRLGEAGARPVAVCSRLGEPGERCTRTTLSELAGSDGEPRSVVVLSPLPVAARPSLAWGRHEDSFAHRGRMVTKAEARAVVLAKLELPAGGVLWDVGAGSGSVAVESAALSPALRVIAVERDPASAERIGANASALGVAVEVVTGNAPGALASLADPDRVFVGGGGLPVLSEALARLAPHGRVVATFAALDRAAAAADRLGNLVQLGVSRGERLADGGWRLAAQNPVFVAWGPR